MKRYLRTLVLYTILLAVLQPVALRGQAVGFLFDREGRFLCRVEAPEAAGYVFMLRDGERPLVARLADPVHDPDSIGIGTRVVLVSKERIRSSLKRAGALRWIHGRIGLRTLYMFKQSGYGGKLDFAVNGEHDIEDSVYYITESFRDGAIAHSRFNFGNFLWGAAAKSVGIPCFYAKLGSHVNACLFSTDGRGKRGHFDAPDDIFSINAGYAWSR